MPTGARFLFGPYELDPAKRRLTASEEPVAISDRQLDVLLLLVARAGQIVSKDDLLQAGWKDVAVGDNSLEQVVSSLRRLLGPGHIETVARRGYRFGVSVERKAARESDAALDALLAPHRAFIEGRAALETLEAGKLAHAREVFEGTLATAPDHASSHIGLANACVMQFEATRTDPKPDAASLSVAAHHAREACRLDPQSGEAWATLGFVLDRAGNRVDAIAASKRAVTLEPDNWRHHFRLAYVGWGEERLRAAHRTLALLPDFPLAHWLAASVHVARQVLPEADRELLAALALDEGRTRFGSVALHWLHGLIVLEQGDEAGALAAFDRELASEHAGHLYTRECAANTWYAIGAVRLRQGRMADAATAFQNALARVSTHPFARIGLVASGVSRTVPVEYTVSELERVEGPALSGRERVEGPAVGERERVEGPAVGEPDPVKRRAEAPPSVDAALVRAAQLVASGAHADAAHIVEDALARAPETSAGWLLPIEPMLRVSAHPGLWARALGYVRNRAS